MKPWITRALQLLHDSLGTPRQELNELDWKSDLSPHGQRLIEHLSAFGNQPGGGFLAFGIAADGTVAGMSQESADRIVNQLANLGRDGIEPPLTIDHAITTFRDAPVLLVWIMESPGKPVHLRGKPLDKAWTRSGGTTRSASRQELGTLLLHSRTPRWEELHCGIQRSDDALLALLADEPVLTMLQRPVPNALEARLAWMADQGWIERDPRGGGYVTNLGAIAVALVAALGWVIVTYPVSGRLGERFADGSGPRPEIWRDTIYAIGQYWPWGRGIGTFVPVFLAAERLEAVDWSHPNRAHNEVLELALEAGLPGLVLLAVLLGLLAWRWAVRVCATAAPQERAELGFAVATLVTLGAHSIVDYPLRSMALAALAGVAAGFILAPACHRGGAAPQGRVETKLP